MPTFSVTTEAGPLNTSAVAKAKGVRLSCDVKNDPAVTGFRRDFNRFLFKRFTSSSDAAADANGVVVYEGPNASHFDSAELTRGTDYWYGFWWIDDDENVSSAGTVRNVTYRGTQTDDIEETAVVLIDKTESNNNLTVNAGNNTVIMESGLLETKGTRAYIDVSWEFVIRGGSANFDIQIREKSLITPPSTFSTTVKREIPNIESSQNRLVSGNYTFRSSSANLIIVDVRLNAIGSNVTVDERLIVVRILQE